MRVALVTIEYPPSIIGGGGIYARNLALELSHLGVEVDVFSPVEDDAELVEHRDDQVNLHKIAVRSAIPFTVPQFWMKLRQEISGVERKNPFDIVHLNASCFFSITGRKLTRAPQAITVHHLVEDAAMANGLGPFDRIKRFGSENGYLMPLIERQSIRFSDQIIAVSNYTRDRVIQTYGIDESKISVVPNGLNRSVRPSPQELKEAIKRMGLPSDGFLLFVGRVDDPRKGLDVLIKAVAEGRIDMPLVVVGSGNQERARTLANSLHVENVQFLGFLSDSSLQHVYHLCTAYIAPSRLEGFGLTILEAQMAGKPVVASDVGAIPEVAGPGTVLVPQGDVKALSEAIQMTVGRDWDEEIIRAQVEFSGQFSWERTGRMTLETYRRCLQRNGNCVDND